MTPSNVSQPLQNVTTLPQDGGQPVAKATAQFDGSDAVIAFSGSGWSANGSEEISLQLWLDGQPIGQPLSLYANSGQMHLCLGRTYVWAPGISPGEHTLMVVAGPTTITDQNDVVSVTVWNLGDGAAVRLADDDACPAGVGQSLLQDTFRSEGGDQLLISASASGWVTTAGQTVFAEPILDDTGIGGTSIYGNNPDQHLATVPTDIVFPEPTRGLHGLDLGAGGSTSTDGGDRAHLTVLEWVNAADAPVVQALSPPLTNVQAQAQQGSGGTIAQASFQSNGGTLLIRSNVSAYASSSGQMLMTGVQVDGTSHGWMSVYANPAETHMTLVSNDLVVTGIAAGQHTFTMIAEENPITDVNDRVSVTILEFPSG
jgi:hypothetical protein